MKLVYFTYIQALEKIRLNDLVLEGKGEKTRMFLGYWRDFPLPR